MYVERGPPNRTFILFSQNIPSPRYLLLGLARTRCVAGQKNVLGHCHVKEAGGRAPRAQTPRSGFGRWRQGPRQNGGRKSGLAKIPGQRPREKARPAPAAPARQRGCPEDGNPPVPRHPTAATVVPTDSPWTETSRSQPLSFPPRTGEGRHLRSLLRRSLGRSFPPSLQTRRPATARASGPRPMVFPLWARTQTQDKGSEKEKTRRSAHPGLMDFGFPNNHVWLLSATFRVTIVPRGSRVLLRSSFLDKEATILKQGARIP